MLRNLLVIGLLFGLIGWGFYNHFVEKNDLKEVQQISENDETIEPVNGKAQTVSVGIEEGDRAPNFKLSTLDGKVLTLSSQKGKKVLLNFWASWCPPCKAEMPDMNVFYQKYHHKVEIFAVNLTMAEKNKQDVTKFVKDHGLTFPILLDVKGQVGNMYQAFTIPTTYVIDTNGIIQKKIIGPLNQETMEKLIMH